MNLCHELVDLLALDKAPVFADYAFLATIVSTLLT